MSRRFDVETTHGIYPANTWGYRTGFDDLPAAAASCRADERIKHVASGVVVFTEKTMASNAEEFERLHDIIASRDHKITGLQNKLSKAKGSLTEAYDQFSHRSPDIEAIIRMLETL